jgi:hypothetical protein
MIKNDSAFWKKKKTIVDTAIKNKIESLGLQKFIFTP